MCRTKLGRKEKRKERKKVEEERGGREKENKKTKFTKVVPASVLSDLG